METVTASDVTSTDLTQDLDGWDLTKQWRRRRIKNVCQQQGAISSNQFGQGLTLCATPWQPC